jgi:hypothetical protein
MSLFLIKYLAMVAALAVMLAFVQTEIDQRGPVTSSYPYYATETVQPPTWVDGCGRWHYGAQPVYFPTPIPVEYLPAVCR